jgi:transcriptional regulator with XRE-family HTH domain
MTAEFSVALRGWRQRRRVSQLELALRAGTTQRHVSFIEGNRSNPGRAMVVRLAEALDVPLRERNAMLLAAGYAPAYVDAPLDDERLEPVRTALDRILEGHLPYPAVVVGRYGVLVSGNDAFWRLVDTAAPELLEDPVSVPRLFLDPAGLAPRIVNFDDWAWHVINAMRQESLRNPDDHLAHLVEELEELVPDRPLHPGPEHLGFAVPLRLQADETELQLLSLLTHFGTTVDVALSELRLEAFLPGDAATAAYLGDRG